MNDAPVSDPVLMTLAGIAYGAPPDIPGYLADSPLTRGDWRVAWIARSVSVPVNFAFLATSARTGACVIAIRGTYPDPCSKAYWDDGAQDSPFGQMAEWPGAPGARVSAGTLAGLDGVLALQDEQGLALEDALRALAPPSSLTVTGHSLGGTLAPVLALRLSASFPDLELRSTSFAGMTPGNGSFAQLFGAGTRFEGKTRRVYNTLDSGVLRLGQGLGDARLLPTGAAGRPHRGGHVAGDGRAAGTGRLRLRARRRPRAVGRRRGPHCRSAANSWPTSCRTCTSTCRIPIWRCWERHRCPSRWHGAASSLHAPRCRWTSSCPRSTPSPT